MMRRPCESMKRSCEYHHEGPPPIFSFFHLFIFFETDIPCENRKLMKEGSLIFSLFSSFSRHIHTLETCEVGLIRTSGKTHQKHVKLVSSSHYFSSVSRQISHRGSITRWIRTVEACEFGLFFFHPFICEYLCEVGLGSLFFSSCSRQQIAHLWEKMCKQTRDT